MFGTLSDKIGRKPIIMAGCLLAALTYFPVFKMLTEAANPDLAAAQAKTKVVVTADPKRVLVPGQPDRTRDRVHAARATSPSACWRRPRCSYENVAGPAGSPATIKIGDKVIDGADRQR